MEVYNRLDPAQLDEIVQELQLEETDLLDQMRASIQSVFGDLWDWIKSAIGLDDDWADGWLDSLNEWLSGLGASPISGQTLLDGLFLGSLAILLCLLGWAGYYLWSHYRPLDKPHSKPLMSNILSPELLKPLAQLPKEMWAPALFSQVCNVLVRQQRLEIGPDTTNVAIVESLHFEPEQQMDLMHLAAAADRALYSDWYPVDADLSQLQNIQSRVLQYLHSNQETSR